VRDSKKRIATKLTVLQFKPACIETSCISKNAGRCGSIANAACLRKTFFRSLRRSAEDSEVQARPRGDSPSRWASVMGERWWDPSTGSRMKQAEASLALLWGPGMVAGSIRILTNALFYPNNSRRALCGFTITHRESRARMLTRDSDPYKPSRPFRAATRSLATGNSVFFPSLRRASMRPPNMPCSSSK